MATGIQFQAGTENFLSTASFLRALSSSQCDIQLSRNVFLGCFPCMEYLESYLHSPIHLDVIELKTITVCAFLVLCLSIKHKGKYIFQICFIPIIRVALYILPLVCRMCEQYGTVRCSGSALLIKAEYTNTQL